MDLAVEFIEDTELMLTVRMPRTVDHLVPVEVADRAEAVVREGVTNVVRHGHASELTLDVETARGALTVSVQDKGGGTPA